jgi:SP family galactose:H+ symporter-like MFS transporter
MSVKTNAFAFWVACLVSVGGILYGYDVGVISGALLFIKDAIPMTDTQMGVIVGAVLGGGLLGTLLAGPIGDYYGRRKLIMLSSLIFIVGVTCILLAETFVLMLCARLLLGVGVGIVAVAVPLYVAELVPAKDRGKYVTFFQLLLTFGIVMAYFVDLFFTPSGNWRGMFAVVLIPALILFFGMLFLPESPRWLIANQQTELARHILHRIRSCRETVEADIDAIQKSLADTQGSWRELFSYPFLLPTLTAFAIAIFNQLTGINSFLQYAPLILKSAGLQSDMITMLGSVGIGILNFLCTLVAITLIDSVGRRPLLLIGVFGVMFSEIYLGFVSHLSLSSNTIGTLSLIGLFAFIVCFAIGPGVVVWLAISELFPTRLRGKGIALCLFLNSLAATLLATFFLPMSHQLGMSKTYWLFAIFSGVYGVLTYFLLPETKTRSLEDIQMDMQKNLPSVLSVPQAE